MLVVELDLELHVKIAAALERLEQINVERVCVGLFDKKLIFAKGHATFGIHELELVFESNTSAVSVHSRCEDADRHWHLIRERRVAVKDFARLPQAIILAMLAHGIRSIASRPFVHIGNMNWMYSAL